MWGRWFLCRRCQTEADLERLQAAVEECKRLDVWQKLKRCSVQFCHTWNWIDQSVLSETCDSRLQKFDESCDSWESKSFGFRTFSCVATHALISKNKEWHRIKIKVKGETTWNSFTQHVHQKQIHANDIRINQTTNFRFPYFFWGICWLLLFSKQIRNGKPRWRSPGTRIGLNIHTAERQVLRLKELQARGVFFAGRDLCQETIFLGKATCLGLVKIPKCSLVWDEYIIYTN